MRGGVPGSITNDWIVRSICSTSPSSSDVAEPEVRSQCTIDRSRPSAIAVGDVKSRLSSADPARVEQEAERRLVRELLQA